MSIVAAAYGEVLVVPKGELTYPNFASRSEVVPEAVATLPSVLVNIVVTASIVGNILHTKARLKRLILHAVEMTASRDDAGQGTTELPKDIFSAAALLIEAALPSSIIGILVALSSSFFPTFRFVAIISWAACTVSGRVPFTLSGLINAHA